MKYLWLLLAFAQDAFSHGGHGGAQVHLHWWEYALIAAAAAALAIWLSRR